MLYVDFVASRAHTTYAMCANHGVAVGRSAATVAHTNLQTVSSHSHSVSEIRVAAQRYICA